MKTCLSILITFLSQNSNIDLETGWVVNSPKEDVLVYTWLEDKRTKKANYIMISKNAINDFWIKTGSCSENNNIYNIYNTQRQLHTGK